MDLAHMDADQRQTHFQTLAQDYARRYAQLVIDAIGGHVSNDAAAILHRIGYELGHDACQTLAREIAARRPATDKTNEISCDGERPEASCGCGYPIVYTGNGWQHDTAPWFWGDDHDPDPDAEAQAAAQAYDNAHGAKAARSPEDDGDDE